MSDFIAKDELKVPGFKERSIDNLRSRNTGSLLYDLKTKESGWVYTSPVDQVQTVSTGIYSFLEQWQLFRFFVLLFYFYNIDKIFSSSKKQVEAESSPPIDIQWKITLSPSFTQIAILKSEELYIAPTESDLDAQEYLPEPITIQIPELREIIPSRILQRPEKSRNLAWSLDENLIAILCGSTGPIVIVSVQEQSVIKIIKPEEISLLNGVAAVEFRKDTQRMNERELLILGFDGFIARLRISKDKETEIEQIYHEDGLFFAGKLHSSATCMKYNIQTRRLYIGGAGSTPSKVGITNRSLSLSVWELLDEPPYQKLVYSTTPASKKSFKRRRTFLRNLKHMYHAAAKRFILEKICFSTDNKLCAGLDDAGHIVLWSMDNFGEEPKVLDTQQMFQRQDSFQNNDIIATIKDITWWSNSAIAVLWSNGDLSVNHIEFYSNLLGKFAENFEPTSQLSEVQDQNKFFVLETHKTKIQPNQQENEDQQAVPVNQQISSIFGEAIEFLHENVDDTEAKEPTGDYYHNDVRLVEFKAVTPVAFIRKKIEENQFDDAVTLAQYYEIDNDLLYQHKWKITTEITVESIMTTLEPIENRIWVVDQCCNQVGSTLSETALLLIYGLYNTIPGQSSFIEIWKDVDVSDIPSVFEQMIITEELGNADAVLIYYRVLLLHYLDRLYVYQASIRSIFEEDDEELSRHFDAEEFQLFKDTPLLDESKHLAEQEYLVSLQRAFSLSKLMNIQRLEILDHIPLTVDPKAYRELLPYPTVLCTKDWRELDFSERLMQHSESFSDTEMQHLSRLEILTTSSTITNSFTNEERLEWFLQRAEKIDKQTGLASNAERLLNYAARTNADLTELIEFHKRFQIYTNIIYQGDSSIDWSSFQNFGDYEILEKLLTNSTPRTVASDLYQRCSNLIQHSNDRVASVRSANGRKPDLDNDQPILENITKETDINQWILVRYLIHQAKQGHLSLCASILRAVADPPSGKPALGTRESFIPSEILFLRTALTCVYANTSTNQWEAINGIYQSIPERDVSILNDYYQSLHDQIDRLEVHLQASDLLSQYTISIPLQSFLNLNANSASQLIQRICVQAGRIAEDLTDKDWLEILSVILDLREKVLEFVSIDFCYSCFCEALLLQQKFKLAREYLCKTTKASKILLKVAKEYFNSATTPKDETFRCAEKCMEMLQDFGEETEAIIEERDLYKATKSLYNIFQFKKLPIQIRLANKDDLLVELVHSTEGAYKHYDDLLMLKHLFDPQSNNKRLDNNFLTEIASVAINKEDYVFALELCNRLMQRNVAAAWNCALRLAFAPSYKHIDHAERILLFQFALCYCPADKIHLIVSKMNHIKSIEQILIQDDHPFNELLDSPRTTHQILQENMRKVEDPQQFLELDSLFHTTLFDYDIIFSRKLTHLDDEHTIKRIDCLIMRAFGLFKESKIQMCIGFLYQAIMCKKFLPRADEIIRGLTGLSWKEDTEKHVDKEISRFISVYCYCLGILYLETSEKLTVQKIIDDYSLTEILLRVADENDEENEYLVMFKKYNSLLDQRETKYFKSEVIPHSFSNLSALEIFYSRLVDMSDQLSDIQELRNILEAWSIEIPLQKSALNDPEDFHILHHCWFKLIEKLLQIGEYNEATQIILSSGNALSKEDENNLQMELRRNETTQCLFFYFKIGLHSRHSDIRQETLDSLIQELKLDGNRDICDASMVRILLLERVGALEEIIQAPCFYSAAMELILSNTIWDTSVPSLKGLAYPIDGNVSCSLPFFVGKLVTLGYVNNAASVVCSSLRLPDAFCTWRNSMFTVQSFLELHQSDTWREKAPTVLQAVFNPNQEWDQCAEQCAVAITMLPWN